MEGGPLSTTKKERQLEPCVCRAAIAAAGGHRSIQKSIVSSLELWIRVIMPKSIRPVQFSPSYFTSVGKGFSEFVEGRKQDPGLSQASPF